VEACCRPWTWWCNDATALGRLRDDDDDDDDDDAAGARWLRRCCFADGVVSYDMRQGDRRFFDSTYDGDAVDGRLSGGLGQLVDGVEGAAANFRARRGSDWVAWRAADADAAPVEIVFRLDAVRSVAAARVHCHDAPDRDVGVFAAAELHFSVGGRVFDARSGPVYFTPARGDSSAQPRYVAVPVRPPRVARFVRVVMHFDRRWIMISEVQFDAGM